MSEKDQKAAQEAQAKEDAAVASAAAKPEDKPSKAAATEVVPVLTEEGEPIPRNSVVRIRTASGSLIDPSGNRITENSFVELLGPDVVKGDWYTVQFEAGLLVVDSVKKLK